MHVDELHVCGSYADVCCTCVDVCGSFAQVDHLQHEADLQLQQLRREIDQAIVKGLQRSRHE